MTKRDKLALEVSELRGRINALSAKDELTDEERAELAKATARFTEAEVEWRAAVISGDGDGDGGEANGDAGNGGDGEGAEVRALIERVELRGYLGAVAAGRPPSGAESELNAALQLPANAVPWEALEVRARTEGPAETERNQLPILGRIFAGSDTAFLGVETPLVPLGQAQYTTLTDGVVAADAAEGAAIAGDATKAASWSSASIKPTRVSASYEWSIEDAAVFPGLEAALRQDLSAAMETALDLRVVTSLLKTAAHGGLANPNNPAAVAKFQDMVDVFPGFVDGKYASMASEVRLLTNAATYQFAYQLYLSSAQASHTEQTAAERVLEIGGGFRVSAHLPAAASNIATSIAVRGMSGWAVAPVWQGLRFVPDSISGAGQGTVKVTAVALVGFTLRRASGEQAKRVKFKLA